MKYVWIGLALLILIGLSLYRFVYTPTQPVENNSYPSEQMDTNSLIIEDIVTGTGAEVKSGDVVSVHYVGTFTDGTKFDSSYDHGGPISFPLGEGRVIQGWDQGLLGMKVGGKRKLIIPPSLAYGASGMPGRIPPNSTLVFEVELVAID